MVPKLLVSRKHPKKSRLLKVRICALDYQDPVVFDKASETSNITEPQNQRIVE